jgi:5'-nucleotidase
LQAFLDFLTSIHHLSLGHDHDYNVNNVNGKFVLKSGCDFKEFSLIKLCANDADKKSFVERIEKYTVDSKVHENELVKDIVSTYLSKWVND